MITQKTKRKFSISTRTNWKNVVERRLFNLKDDPAEQINLYKKRAFRGVCFKLERLLKQELRRSARLNRSGKRTHLQKSTVEHMKSLGYL